MKFVVTALISLMTSMAFAGTTKDVEVQGSFSAKSSLQTLKELEGGLENEAVQLCGSNENVARISHVKITMESSQVAFRRGAQPGTIDKDAGLMLYNYPASYLNATIECKN